MRESIVSPMAVLPVHFDVPEHYVPLHDFIEVAKGIEIVSQNLASKIFREKVFISVVVLPSDEGSLKENIGMLILGSFLALTFVNDDYLEGLIGRDPKEIRREAGVNTREAIGYLVNSTKNFLEQENDSLCEKGINYDDFSVAYSGKDMVFEACIKNTNINGLGFDDTDLFSVSRAGFSSRVRPPKEEETETKLLLHKVVILSPNISRESKAQWRVQDVETKKTLSFHMEDLSFKEQMFNHQYSFQADDTMTVLVKYEKQMQGDRVFWRKSAIKVYQFNEIEFEKIPDELEIIKILENDEEEESSQPSLF